MVFGPFIDVFERIKSLKPSFVSKKPHFNFITIHYFWIIGLTIIGSILLYPARTGPPGGLQYIDALFFASGACTQSGLNTVDVNLLNTYQQVVLTLLPMITNPITINTFVVFLRLYWFEKRFQHIAREAKKLRRTLTGRSFSKSRSTAADGSAVDRAEMGVNGRHIVVMHDTTRANGTGNASVNDVDRHGIHSEKPEGYSEEEGVSNSSSGSTGTSSSSSVAEKDTSHLGLNNGPTQTIKFADQVKRSDGLSDIRVPEQRSAEEHLAVLKRQREGSKGALRIPGPREQDQGMTPQHIDDADDGPRRRGSTFTEHSADDLERTRTNETAESGRESQDNTKENRRGIRIEEPQKPGHFENAHDDAVAVKHIFAPLRPRKPRVMQDDDDHQLHKAKSRTSTFAKIRQTLTQEKEEPMPYLSWEATVGRNSAFVDLDQRQREELGGIEYRSLKSLALILVLYFWGYMVLAWVGLIPWIRGDGYFGNVVTSDGQNRVWWGFFTGVSAFNDVGFTLTPDSMISFQGAVWPLLLMSFLIIIGNTGFPIMLRFIIWVTSLYAPRGSGIWEELKFLLDHPRRCFTLLFPSSATWWLFWILVILNGLDLLFFIILDLGNPTVVDLPVGLRILAGWFQAVSTRTAGFAVVNLANLHPGVQVSYMLMMYISVLPIAISVRRTNVYEEKSLGIWGSAEAEREDESEPSYVGAHLRRQLSFDLWYIFLGLFIIAIAEGSRLQSNDGADQAFTLFAVLFEVVSAYGTVGLSLGYPTINASFSAEFGVIGKLVIIAMQIRGRHRGLPYELDRAILLPSESLHSKENEDALNAERLKRRNSGVNVANELDRLGSGGSKATGATRATGRSRRMSVVRDGGNFLSNLLHPGPTNIHRARSQTRRRSGSTDMGGDDGMSMRERLPHSMTGGLMETPAKAQADDERDLSPHAKRRSTAL